MTFEYTVKQCAEKLGISEQRVYQLIRDGLLPAEKTAGRYFVEESAVDARAQANPTAGRPSKTTRDTITRYTLMNRQHEVLDVEFDEDANEFSAVTDVHDVSRAPLGFTSPRGSKVSLRELTSWWAHRSIPVSRAGMDAKLASLGVRDSSRIPFRSLGLSLSDQYWLRPEGESIDWREVNFFTNDFEELNDAGWLSQVGLLSPDNTSEGQLSKRWVKVDGKPVLLKGGGQLNQEPYNELAATKVFAELLDLHDFVPYSLQRSKADGVVSACADFLDDEEEYIPAMHVMKVKKKEPGASDYQHYLDCCARLGIDGAELAMAKMLACDDILGNTDRHWRNFGVVRNVNTLECRMAPIFDTGNSLWVHASDAALQAGDFSFEAKPFYANPNRQLRLVEDYSWLDLSALDGLSDVVIDVLSKNPKLEERAACVGRAVQQRIDRLKVIAE